MLKKIITLILSVLIILAFPVSSSALSEGEITAPSAVLMEPTTKKVLYEKNPHEVRPCASITKVMTMLLVMEAIEDGKFTYEDTVTASAHAASMGGSDIWLVEGETMTVHEMIKATMVASANDAAVALAELVSGTEDEFVALMNEKAKALGMKDTVFKNCNGLDEEGHVTSAYDVAIMSSELIKHEKIFEYSNIWLDYLRDGETQIVNTNKLLKTYNGITGLKTGTTDDAGSCMSATAERDGLSLVAVVLGCTSGTDRFKDAATLLDFGFANYMCTTLEVPKDELTPIKVKNGMQSQTDIYCDFSENLVLPKGSTDKAKAEVSLKEELEAPVKKDQKVGLITYTVNGEKVAQADVLSKSEVDKITFSKVFSCLISSLVTL